MASPVYRVPVLRALLPFVGGICCALWFADALPVHLLLFVTGLSLAGLFFWHAQRYQFKHRIVFGWLMALLWWGLGCVLTHYQKHLNDPLHFSKVDTQEGLVIGRLTDAPQEKTNAMKVVLEVNAIKTQSKWWSSKGKVLVYLPKDSSTRALQVDDQIVFQPQFKEVSGPGNPGQFDYRKYLAFHLIYHQTYLQSGRWALLERSNKRFNVRHRLLEVLQQKVENPDCKAIAAALVLGYKSHLEGDIQKSYAAAGAMHVLAVSGLHVGIVFLLMQHLTRLMKHRRRWGGWIRIAILLAALWSYAGLTGFSPSVLRACTMFSFIAVGSNLSRPVNVWNSIAASAFLLLVVQPYLLVEVGFQLSYLAVMGIVYFYPRFSALWQPRFIVWKWLWSVTCVSLAAQLATFPLSVFYFHQFPNYFLVSNLVVIPAATVILYLGILVLITGAWTWLSEQLGALLNGCIEVLNAFVGWIENLPGALTQGLHIQWWECLVWYVLIVLYAGFFRARQTVLLWVALGGTVLVVGHQLYEDMTHEQQRKLIVYDMKGITAVNLIDGTDNILFSNLEADQRRKMDFAAGNQWIELGLETEKHQRIQQMSGRFMLSNIYRIDNPHVFQKKQFVQFYDKTLMILTPEFKVKEKANSIAVDYLILSENPTVAPATFMEKVTCKTLIIASSNSETTIEKWLTAMDDSAIPIHVIAEDGAFVEDLR